MRIRIAPAIAWLLLPFGVAAQIVPIGAEFQINAHTAESQRFAALAVSPAGSFIVTWTGYNQDGSSAGVFARRFDGGGEAEGTEFQVSAHTISYQRFTAAAAGDEGFVVVWESYQDGERTGVFGRRYDAAGQGVGAEFQVNTYTTSYQRLPAVAAGTDGRFVVVWESFRDGSGYGVFGQRYDGAGQAIGSEFQVNGYTIGYQRAPAAAVTSEGAVAVAWEGAGRGDSTGVLARRYDSAGREVGSEFQVNGYTSGYQPTVAAGTNESFLIAWHGVGDGDLNGVFARLYDGAGRPMSGEFQVNARTIGNQRLPAVTARSDGTFVAAWESAHDGGSYGVFGQLYDGAGQRVGTEFQINSHTAGYQRAASLGAAGDGTFAVAWQSFEQDGRGPGVFGQRFGEPASTPTATPTQPVPAACLGDCGGDGAASVDELITGVTIALGHLPIVECRAFDIDENGRITIDELVAAVAAALSGCGNERAAAQSASSQA